jgi:hypothetical protein
MSSKKRVQKKQGKWVQGETNRPWRFYRVKAVYEYPGAEKILMEGMFLPKGKESTPAEIKRQCADFLRANVKFHWDDEVDPSGLKLTLTYTAISSDFVVVGE